MNLVDHLRQLVQLDRKVIHFGDSDNRPASGFASCIATIFPATSSRQPLRYPNAAKEVMEDVACYKPFSFALRTRYASTPLGAPFSPPLRKERTHRRRRRYVTGSTSLSWSPTAAGFFLSCRSAGRFFLSGCPIEPKSDPFQRKRRFCSERFSFPCLGHSPND